MRHHSVRQQPVEDVLMKNQVSLRSTTRVSTTFAVILSCVVPLCTATTHAQLTGDLIAHDPSTVIYDSGRYYSFSTGDHVGVRSSANLTSWTYEPTALDSIPSWIYSAVPGYSGSSLWAPDVIYLNGQYHLYYSASVWGTKLSAIGHATSPTLDPDAPNYGWTDQGMVISSNHSSPYNAIDPSLMLDDSTGRLWMTWGSFNNGIYVKELDPLTGDPLNSSPGINVAAPSPTPEIEGAAMMQHDGYYYMFVNWGGCCSGDNSTYNIRVGRSTSPTGPFLDKDGVNMLNDGGTLFLDDDGQKIGPGHFSFANINGQDTFSYHYYDADQYWTGDMTGLPLFAMRNLYWTSDAWPSIAAVNPNWTGSASSSWSQASNWTDATVPDGAGHIANFTSNSAGQYNVSLGSNRTLGTINFRGFGSYTIGSNAGPTITLSDINGELPTLNVAERQHTIAAPIAAQDNLGVNVTNVYGLLQSSLTLTGGVTAPQLTKYGGGELILDGINNFAGSVFVRKGELTITGTVTANSYTSIGYIQTETGILNVQGSGSFTANGDLNIGDTGQGANAATGTLNLSDQASVTVTTNGGFYVGSGYFSNTPAYGTVNHSGGTLTVNRTSDGSFIIGGRNSEDAVGVYNFSGGTVNANTNVFVGGRGEGTVNQTGGTFNANASISIGRYNGSTGIWTISDSTLNQTDTGNELIVGQQGQGTLTITRSGEVNASGTVLMGDSSSGSGTINLNSGTLSLPTIERGSGTAIFNFNGGTLRATANTSTFMQGLSQANVQFGGAVIDTQSFDITIAQPLIHDSSLGSTPDGGLIKRGDGALTLTATQTYTGNTTIENGTLALTSDASINNVTSFNINPAAILALEITDTADLSTIDVNGNFAADGTLRITLAADATAPQFGDAYDLLDFATLTGAFDVLDLPSLSPGLVWNTANLLNAGILTIAIADDIAGDLNNDGYVGLDDLDLILNNWNTTVRDGHPSDPSGDNFVGLDDLDIVLNNWNNGTPPDALTNIPEPTTLALLSLVGIAMTRRPHYRIGYREHNDVISPRTSHGPLNRGHVGLYPRWMHDLDS